MLSGLEGQLEAQYELKEEIRLSDTQPAYPPKLADIIHKISSKLQPIKPLNVNFIKAPKHTNHDTTIPLLTIKGH